MPESGRAVCKKPTGIPRSQPIRSAITVAGIPGNSDSNSRIWDSTTSTIEPGEVRT
jgi:hypothetical protein